jgi:hypothetical protein
LDLDFVSFSLSLRERTARVRGTAAAEGRWNFWPGKPL